MGFIGIAGRTIGDALAERLMFGFLTRLKIGKLRVELPNGTTRLFDSGSPGPEAVLQVYDRSFFRNFLIQGEIGFGEAYQQGIIDSPDLVALLSLGVENRQAIDFNHGVTKLLSRRKNLRLHRNRGNTVDGSKENIHAHYDLGNDFFKLFLDETMTYSAAVFESDDETLKQAQENKYRRLCELVRLSENDRLLEIGSGWGGFAMFAAKTYGCHVTTITISEEQFALAKGRIEAAGLADLVQIQIIDYRKLEGEFDKIVSIEMFEAVGVEYFETFFLKCSSLLVPGGRLAMQVITVPDRAFRKQKVGVNWIQKYIFPGGVLPSLTEMERVNGRTGLVLDSSHDLGADYAVTLHRWRDAFWANMDALRAQGYDDYFIKTWDYYLAACEAGFLTRITGDVQIAFDKVR
jgi:cyclopropane-fatty-acyl-phospholipid synthase